MKRRSKMEKTQHLLHMADRFRLGAEAPDGRDWWELFECLATRDVPRMEKLMASFNVDTNTDY